MVVKKQLQIIKWNLYNAKVPFTTNFKNYKIRPIIVVAITGDDAIILPISSKVHKKTKFDVEINLDLRSLIKVGNIQSVNKKDILSPYYSPITKKILRIKKSEISQVKQNLNEILIK